MSKKIVIEIDEGDAVAAYSFLIESVQRIVDLTEKMPANKRYVYLDQPKRWDRVAIALGEACGEVDLPSLIPHD